MGMRNFFRDLAFALRTLAKAPMTVAITVVSLGLGIGAVTTVFATAEGLLYPPAPGLRDPEGLVTVFTSEEDGELYGSSSYADYRDVLEVGALEDATASAVRLASLEVAGEQEPLIAEVVVGNFFEVTGIRPVVGRPFLPEEGRPAAGAPVAVLGYHLWTERFEADPGVVGRTVRLNGTPVTVVGVAPKGVTSRRVPVRPDIWYPLGSPPDANHTEGLEDRGLREFSVLGRYAQGATLTDLQSQLTVLSSRLADEHGEAWKDDKGRDRVFTAVSERASRVNPGAWAVLGGIAVFFFAATGLVLLIACTNVTGLFVVRAVRRSKEISLRLALGAKRRQVVRLLLAEGLVLGVAAGVVGLGFANLLAGAMASYTLPVNVPVRLDFAPDGRAYVFAFLTALATAMVFSLVPALRASRVDLVSGLKARSGVTRRRWRFSAGSFLVVTQFAASLVLLGGAGLFLRSLQQSATLELGLDPQGVALMSKAVPDGVTWDGMETYYRDLQQRLQRLPGVQEAGLSRGVELTLLQVGSAASFQSTTEEGGDEGVSGGRNGVTPGYMEMMGIPLLRGRTIQEGDVAGATRVAVVNERFAQVLWPGEDPVGRWFTLVDRSPWRRADTASASFQVVGVAGQGSYMDVGDPPAPYVWTSLYQDPSRSLAVTVKGASADAMVDALRAGVRSEPGEVPVLAPTTMDRQVDFQFIHLRLASKVLGWGGGFGLFLALIGVYGMVSFTVAQRTREIAVRRAVGADAGQVVGSVVRQGIVLAGVGGVLGLAVLLPLAHLLRGVLVGVGPLDPVALGGGAALLAVTSLAASFLPARRAARIDPMESLRQE